MDRQRFAYSLVGQLPKFPLRKIVDLSATSGQSLHGFCWATLGERKVRSAFLAASKKLFSDPESLMVLVHRFFG